MLVETHIRVKGRVQGVGFRYFVSRKADIFGITGFVRNLADGSVEIIANGDRSAVEQFIADVRIGPGGAIVQSIDVKRQENPHHYNNFEIRD